MAYDRNGNFVDSTWRSVIDAPFNTYQEYMQYAQAQQQKQQQAAQLKAQQQAASQAAAERARIAKQEEERYQAQLKAQKAAQAQQLALARSVMAQANKQAEKQYSNLNTYTPPPVQQPTQTAAQISQQQNIPTTFKTPYGTLTQTNGEWTLEESPDVKAAREQVAQLQSNLTSQLGAIPDSEQYKQDYIKANMPEAERLLAQNMASRGLLNSSAMGDQSARLATDMTNSANLSSDQYRQNQINALLSQLQGTSNLTGQQQSNASNIATLGMQAGQNAQSNALNWGQLGQQNQQFNQSQAQQNNQFQQSLLQRQAESARDYGLQQANLLSSIFSSGSLF